MFRYVGSGTNGPSPRYPRRWLPTFSSQASYTYMPHITVTQLPNGMRYIGPPDPAAACAVQAQAQEDMQHLHHEMQNMQQEMRQSMRQSMQATFGPMAMGNMRGPAMRIGNPSSSGMRMAGGNALGAMGNPSGAMANPLGPIGASMGGSMPGSMPGPMSQPPMPRPPQAPMAGSQTPMPMPQVPISPGPLGVDTMPQAPLGTGPQLGPPST